MTFKEIASSDDLNVFLNTDEMAEMHSIEGTQVACVLDEGVVKENGTNDRYSLQEEYTVLYAKTEELQKAGVGKKGYGSMLLVDDRTYLVQSWKEEFGMTEIELAQNMMR